MIEQIIKNWWSEALGLIFGVLYINSWIQSQRTDNVTKIRKIYNGMIDDLKGKLLEVDELKVKIDQLQEEIRQLRIENENLRKELEKKERNV